MARISRRGSHMEEHDVIVGVGIDVVDVGRFVTTLARVPRLRDRLFTSDERELPDQSLAARFAAKEAVAKALGAPGGLRWHDCTVTRAVGAPPRLLLTGTVAARAAELGVTGWHLSLSHDAGVAAAIVVAERGDSGSVVPHPESPHPREG